MAVIGLIGDPCCEKKRVVEYLQHEYDFTPKSFEQLLYDIMKTLFGFNYGDNMDVTDPIWNMTPTEAIEVVRKWVTNLSQFGDKYWSLLMEKEIKKILW